MKLNRVSTQTLPGICLGLILGSALMVQGQNPVTFQVNMSVQGGFTEVYARGSFNNWGEFALTDNGSGVYTGTVDIAGAPGSVVSYKYFFRPGDNWESPASTCGENRTFSLIGGPQVLPVVYYNDTPPVLPENNVTFQVDMSAQVLLGAFTNGVSQVTVSGSFNGWGGGDLLTNDPSLLTAASNIYSGTLKISGVDGACMSYKYRADGGWESPASTGGNNRTFKIAGPDQVLPLVFYNDSTPCDLVQAPTPVTFTLQLTNGTVATDGTVFDRDIHRVYINGEFLGWWSWGGGETLDYELTNNPVGSDLFQQTITIPRGKSLRLNYKYGIQGADNEAPRDVNHVRYIRTTGGAVVMPIDQFGTNYPPVVEASFGDLAIGKPTNGTVPISWLGRQCVTLQTRTSLTAGQWIDLPATEATSSTNWPATAPAQFFRLQKRP